MVRAYSAIRSILNGLRSVHNRGVYLVSDATGWVLDWEGHSLQKELQGLGIRAQVIDDPIGLRKQVIHFINRYRFLNSETRRLSEQNDIFVTWYHGDPGDPAFEESFNKLMNKQAELTTLVTSCGTTHRTLVQAGFPTQNIEILPIGVDTHLFHPVNETKKQSIRKSFGIADDTFCVGSFQKDGIGWGDGMEPKLIKGPDTLLETFLRLKKTQHKIFVLLSGPARGYVKKGLRKIGIPFAHRYCDDYRDIVAFYQACDAVIIPSRAEGGPKALGEAWATGIPVVSTRVGMPADLILDGENGLIVSVEDDAALAEGLVRLIEDADLRNKCRAQGLMDVKALDWVHVARLHHEKLYSVALSQ